MKAKLLALAIASGALLLPVCNAAEKSSKPKVDSDMQRAIAWEHFKDAAAARQARLEAKHPSVTYSDRSANREVDESTQGKKVIDQGPPAYRKDKK